jgi:hypothetical protein
MILQSDDLKGKSLLGDLDVEGRFVLNTHYLSMSDNQKKIFYFYLLVFAFNWSDDHNKELLEHIL